MPQIWQPSVETIPVSDEAAQAYDYVGMLESALSDYHSCPNCRGQPQPCCCLIILWVLTIGVPIMKKAKMAEALKTEFNAYTKTMRICIGLTM